MRRNLSKTYTYLVTLPDRLYPFASEVEGKLVRGKRSYEHTVARAFHRHGEGRIGYKLILYREICHLVGSVIFILSATLVSKDLFGSDKALYILLVAGVVGLSYQEFYLHPRDYGQTPHKGVIDWLSWVIPMVLYVVLFK